MATTKAATAVKQKCTCSRCKKTMSEIKFYTHPDGSKDEMCKDCLCAHVNNFEPDTFLWILERMDVPYIPPEWNKLRDDAYRKDPSKIGGPAVLGKYLSKMKLKQWVNPETGKPYRWADSEEVLKKKYAIAEKTEEEKAEEEAYVESLKEQLEQGLISEAEYRTLAPTEKQVQEDIVFPSMDTPTPPPQQGGFMEDNFLSEADLPDYAADLTDEDKIYLALKWGRLYKPSEWVELEKKYDEMDKSFDIQDADSRNTLILMCKTDLKMNQALDIGDIDGYQKLARVSDSLRKSGKFTAAQNKDKDNGQIDCTGVLIAECERQGGFIERYATDIPKDIIDKIMKDEEQYVYNLITKDFGFGQQIENYLKKIELEHEALNKDITDEDDEIQDEDIAEYYERIAEEKEEDSHITLESNAYFKEEDEDGAS